MAEVDGMLAKQAYAGIAAFLAQGASGNASQDTLSCDWALWGSVGAGAHAPPPLVPTRAMLEDLELEEERRQLLVKTLTVGRARGERPRPPDSSPSKSLPGRQRRPPCQAAEVRSGTGSLALGSGLSPQ